MLELYKTYWTKPNWDDLKDIIDETESRRRYLELKHPWIPIITKWVSVVLSVLLVISCFVWGVNIHINHKAESLTVVAMAEYQEAQQAEANAEQKAIEEQQKSEAAILEKESEMLAKLFAGLQNFEEKYGYSENDYLTYARCVFNRVDNPAYPNSLAEVINQESQWVGYSDSNQVLTKYKTIAKKAITEWRNETSKPVANDYVYAELSSRGIYLKNKYEADAYIPRWRYS